MEEYNAYTRMLRDNGRYVAGEALQPTATATTVRIRDGQTLTTDGPFAETKEALGGFYLVEAKDLDEALTLGGACPGAKWGSIEVRPIVDFSAGEPRPDPPARPAGDVGGFGARGHRARLPRGVGAVGRHPDPRPRRLRPRRGGGPGRVRAGARGLADRGRPGNPGRGSRRPRETARSIGCAGDGRSPRRPSCSSARRKRTRELDRGTGGEEATDRTASTTGCG